MMSPIITLTTDWGCRDFFVGKFKGRLLSLLPEARIVDITHEVEPFNIKSATYVAQNACFEFPQGTIHIIDVNSNDSPESPSIVVKCEGQYFICTDNGLPYALFSDRQYEAVVVDKVYWDSSFYTFIALDYFCKVAQLLGQGADLADLGYPCEKFNSVTSFSVITKPDALSVSVDYIDSYGNVDLNISYADFEQYRNGRSFKLQVRDVVIDHLDFGYVEKGRGESYRKRVLLTVSSSGQLQLAINNDSVEQIFGMEIGSGIEIKFY